jgi:LPXTG-motif cell wall-anchored protein
MKKRTLLTTALALSLSLIVGSISAFAAAPTVPGKYIDNFERTNLTVDDTTKVLNDGTTIYWNNAYVGDFSIVSGALVAKFTGGGNYRLATNDEGQWKYCVIRIKGDANAVNDKIYTRMGATDAAINDGTPTEHSLAVLKGPDGKVLPAITNTYQDIVIDLAKNGLAFGPGGNEFQIGTWQPMELNIDYIFMTNENPLAPVKTPEATATSTAPEATVTSTSPKTGDTTPIVVALGILGASGLSLAGLSFKKSKKKA